MNNVHDQETSYLEDDPSIPKDRDLQSLFSFIYLNLFELICLNLFFLFSCLLIFTIPNAIISLTYINIGLILNYSSKPQRKYWRIFFRFRKRWLLASFSYVFILLLLITSCIVYFFTIEFNSLLWVFFGFNLIAIILVIMCGFYFFPLLIITEHDLLTIWKNSFGMVVVEIKHTILVFSGILLLWLFPIRFFTELWIVYVLIVFSLSNFIVNFFCFGQIKKYITDSIYGK